MRAKSRGRFLVRAKFFHPTPQATPRLPGRLGIAGLKFGPIRRYLGPWGRDWAYFLCLAQIAPAWGPLGGAAGDALSLGMLIRPKRIYNLCLFHAYMGDI